ncbi:MULTISPECIES: hypothetical protein [unclassified Corallococcus]|uniref:hypothetical protein n=1 Tax=unclassified Corallococcus TaxID=2685029 RepID=UPI001A8F53F6|nr:MULTISPECIES: hypothetical protein [unclassified Corallococcus]MBN9682975.1 hypothetical protein [Corallococcus sp. NCSPR001]WAS89530.1 hypothetical protein O0N60_00630 [Corallococcus sp. NCRR]
MGVTGRTGPIEALRNLTVSLQRVMAAEIATGVVRGTADGIREEVPGADGQLNTLLQDLLTVLSRMVHEAAEREPGAPAEATEVLAGAAMEGALKALEKEWNDGGLPLHGFVVRLNHLFDEVVSFAHSRTDEIRTPGERAQAMARGVVKAATEQLHDSLPAILEDARGVVPLGEEVAAKVGRGLVLGVESKLREDSGVLVELVERAGQGLVRGLAAGLHEELVTNPKASAEALGASLAALAERTAAATVRGAGSALAQDALRWRESPRNQDLVRRTSREITAGALEALGARLRRPLMALAGAGSALVALTVLSSRWRHA